MATKTVSIVTGGTNSAVVTAEEINAQRTDFFSAGIVDAITLNTGSGGTGGFALNAQSTPNMTIRASAGKAIVTGTPSGGNSQNVRVYMSTFEDITIPANSSGSTKYDWIYISLDAAKLTNPGANKDDIATLVVSRSSSSSTDNGTPPTYGYKLGIVTVANAAASITNSNITDSRVQSGVTAAGPLAIGTAALANASVTPGKLATGASSSSVATSQSTASTSYTNLATAGPAVTVTIGANGMALVSISALIYTITGAGDAYASFAVSGATTTAASDGVSISNRSTNGVGTGRTVLVTGLTPGSTTFTMQYRVTADTGNYVNRNISVVPL